MESGVGFPFYLSPQVRLDAKLKVVKLVDPGATMQPFYVTAQVFSCGVPMHGVTCSTSEPTAREAGSMRTVWWGHWITLPVQYKDVDRGSYIALKVFDGDNREVASTRVGFFDENRCMREGQQRLLLEVAAPLAGSDSDSGDGDGAAAEAAAAAAAAAAMAAATPMMSEEDAEAEMREWMRLYRIKERLGKGQLDIPKCSWLDAMTFDHLSKVRKRARAVERTCVQRAYLYVELPFFGHPVVYSEQPAQHHWFRYTNTARAQRISLDWSKRLDGSTGRVYYVNLKSKAVQWDHPHVSADSDAGGASSGAYAKSMVEDVPARWRQELSLVFDPEEHQEVDVVERYFTKIARLTGGTAAAAPPSREQRRELALICTAPMFPGELEKREAELLWRFRHSLTSDPKALTKFARCVDWDDATQVEEAMVLFHQWEESSAISVADALLLLAAEFKDAGVREFAVSVLERSDDDDLILYLLQLVQALRYEPQLKKLVEDGMPTETEAELAAQVPLVRFLNTRARKNLALANNYNWYLQVEMSGHATTGESDGQSASRLALEKMMYSMVCGSFHEVLRQNGQLEVLEYFRQQQDLLGKAYRVGMTRKGENADSKKARMIRDLQPDSFGDDAIVETAVALPHMPDVVVTGVVPGGSKVFKSALLPFALQFTVRPRADSLASSALAADAAAATAAAAGVKDTAEKDTEGRNIAGSSSAPAAALPLPLVAAPQHHRVMFKIGDDLRQDQLIIQMISLMDRLLKRVGMDLRLTPYRIIATSQNNGLMEFVPAIPLSGLRGEYKSDIALFLRTKHPDPSGPFGIDREVHENFVRSCAGYAVITYLLGIGDRHLDNIMIKETGEMLHIDFGWIFGRDPKLAPPAIRVTKQMVSCMGGDLRPPAPEYRRFRELCVQAFLQLRKHTNLILSLLTLMMDAGLEAVEMEDLRNVRERFVYRMGDEEAERDLLGKIDTSVKALWPEILEFAHRIAASTR